MEWLLENLATLLIGLALLGVVVAIVVRLIKNRKEGKSSCGCNCKNCPSGGSCHKKK